MNRPADPQASRLITARSLHVDGYTSQVIAGLREAGIRPILLKGPALATWLYRDGSPRPYVDCDVLVSPELHDAAERTLESLGFEQEPAPPELVLHARAWMRKRDGAQVDLHSSLAAVSVGPLDAWRAISSRTETAQVGGAAVEVPTTPVRAMIVALHVAHHGPETERPVEDLRRAIYQSSLETWEEAAKIAEELNALAPFAAGLRTLPEGRQLALRLGLAGEQLLEAAMERESPARIAIGFERLAARAGPAARLRFLLEELVPSADFIRWWWPRARRGPLHLAVGYGWRWLWLLRHSRASLRLWREDRSRRRLGSTRP